MGYVWAENPIDLIPGNSPGEVVQSEDLAAVRYSQGLMGVTNQHRITGVIDIQDFLPGIDVDMMAGGMFRDTEQLGASITTSIASYWLGGGMTWRFGRGLCDRLNIPNHWCNDHRYQGNRIRILR